MNQAMKFPRLAPLIPTDMTSAHQHPTFAFTTSVGGTQACAGSREWRMVHPFDRLEFLQGVAPAGPFELVPLNNGLNANAADRLDPHRFRMELLRSIR
ncbi:MAG: hypothetical protein IT539_12230 [Bradyrhizobiaceae bacterium]|nr:hypothetical protein [Bradyrhizobiaceae bacterium]